MRPKVVINIFTDRRRKKRRPEKRFTYRWSSPKYPQTFVEGLMARITTEEQVAITVSPKTAHGRPAAIDGNVSFSSSDESVATVESTGPLSGLVKAVGPGVCQILAAFDADLDAGEERPVEMSGALEVVGAEAATGEIVFGTPEAQPAV